jgi:hypothetical protein
VPPVIVNDNTPSKEFGELGIVIGLHLTPISNKVKTSQSFFNLTTALLLGVGLEDKVGVGVLVVVGVNVGVVVLVGVNVGV